jgi:hypothetical protein
MSSPKNSKNSHTTLKKVISKVQRRYKGKVYDLRVKDVHSYSVDDMVVHNSGAGSLICYALGITTIDPIRFELFFERFLNPSRMSESIHEVEELKFADFKDKIMPSIDIELIE